MSLIEEAQAKAAEAAAKMTPEQIRERLAKINEQKAKQAERNKVKNANLTPEERAARSAKHKEYQDKNPEKFKAQRAAYNKKPEVIERRKAYMKKRNDE